MPVPFCDAARQSSAALAPRRRRPMPNNVMNACACAWCFCAAAAHAPIAAIRATVDAHMVLPLNYISSVEQGCVHPALIAWPATATPAPYSGERIMSPFSLPCPCPLCPPTHSANRDYTHAGHEHVQTRSPLPRLAASPRHHGRVGHLLATVFGTYFALAAGATDREREWEVFVCVRVLKPSSRALLEPPLRAWGVT